MGGTPGAAAARAVVVAACCIAVMAAAGCSPQACTDVGSVRGISVTIEPAAAGGVTALTLTTCPTRETCRTSDVVLTPGSSPGPETCTGSAPDAACAVSMVPTGELVGWAEVPDLSTGPTQVSARLRRSGQTVDLAPLTITPTMVYPNGPDCGGENPQGSVVIGPDGLH